MNELQLDDPISSESTKDMPLSLAVGLGRELSSVHFSSKSDEWGTPQWLFDELNRKFKFTLDPCSTHANAKCKRHFTVVENGLVQDWSREVVFMNPPYGREISSWMKKAFESSQKDRATVVCLVPSRTDTVWWHSFAMSGKIHFFQGRLKLARPPTAHHSLVR